MGCTGVVSVVVVAAVVLGLSSWTNPISASEAPSAMDASALARLLLGTVESCASDGLGIGACLGHRAERWSERALKMPRLPLAEGVSFVRTSRGNLRSVGNPLQRFLKSFSLQVTPPTVLTDPVLLREAVEKGRGKLKKYWKPLLLVGSAMKAYLFIAAVATLALFAGKALLISKLALFLALSAAYKRYFSQKKDTVEVIKVPHGGHHQESSYHHHSSHNSGHQEHKHQHQHYSSSEWEGSYGSEGGEGGGGDYYDKRRNDKGQMGAAAATVASSAKAAAGSDLAYRGHHYRAGDENGMWSKRDDGGDWKGEEETGLGREERSAPWRGVIRRYGPVAGYDPTPTTWK